MTLTGAAQLALMAEESGAYKAGRVVGFVFFWTLVVVVTICIIIVAVRLGSRSGAPPRIQAGWHPDPARPGILRWWDGTRWTEHTHEGR